MFYEGIANNWYFNCLQVKYKLEYKEFREYKQKEIALFRQSLLSIEVDYIKFQKQTLQQERNQAFPK